MVYACCVLYIYCILFAFQVAFCIPMIYFAVVWIFFLTILTTAFANYPQYCSISLFTIPLLFDYCPNVGHYSDPGKSITGISIPQRRNHHLQLRVNKHHTVEDWPTSVLALSQRPIASIDVRGIYRTNFSDWGKRERDKYSNQLLICEGTAILAGCTTLTLTFLIQPGHRMTSNSTQTSQTTNQAAIQDSST
jgi:hypothetical protein